MSIGCDDWSFSFTKECDEVAYQCIFCDVVTKIEKSLLLKEVGLPLAGLL